MVRQTFTIYVWTLRTVLSEMSFHSVTNMGILLLFQKEIETVETIQELRLAFISSNRIFSPTHEQEPLHWFFGSESGYSLYLSFALFSSLQISLALVRTFPLIEISFFFQIQLTCQYSQNKNPVFRNEGRASYLY